MRVKAVVVRGPREMTVEARPLGAPRSYEAVVRVVYGGICGSDLHYWRDGRVGDFVLRSPMVLGHEVVGVVAEPAADGSGPPAGARVAVHPARVCGRCGHCLGQRQNLCDELRYLGSAARTPHTDGGFTECLVVAASRLVPIPDGLDLRTAALAEPTSVALHGLRRAGQVGRGVEGADVLVVGAGPIGLLCAALSRTAGAATVTAVDLHDEPLEMALKVGATHVVRAGADGSAVTGSGTADDPAATGSGTGPVDTRPGVPGADVVFESSGSSKGLVAALEAVRRGGTLVNVGHLPAGGVTAPLHLAVTRELTLAGSSRFYHEMPDALEIMARAADRFAPIVTAVFGLDDVEAAFARAADARRSSKVLLSFTRDAPP